MDNIPDDPIIERMERTGYGRKVSWPICPKCRAEASRFFVADGEVIGCDVCVSDHDAWEWEADHHYE